MGFVHDDDGPAQPQHVDQRGFRVAVRAFPQIVAAVGGDVREVFEKNAVLIVDLAPGRVFHPKRLEGRNDDHGLPVHRGARQTQGFLDGNHFHRAAGRFQRPAVGVARIAQRGGGLVENGVAGHQPQHHCPFGVQEFVHRQPGGVTGQQGFPAAGRHAQTDIRHSGRQAGYRHGEVRYGLLHVVAQLHRLKGRFGASVFRALAEKITQRAEHSFLIVLEGDHDTLIS